MKLTGQVVTDDSCDSLIFDTLFLPYILYNFIYIK